MTVIFKAAYKIHFRYCEKMHWC